MSFDLGAEWYVIDHTTAATVCTLYEYDTHRKIIKGLLFSHFLFVLVVGLFLKRTRVSLSSIYRKYNTAQHNAISPDKAGEQVRADQSVTTQSVRQS